MPRSALAVLSVVVAVVAANASFLLGLREHDPLLYFSGLGRPVAGIAPGLHTLDGNVGYTVQALGHLAAVDWLHGQVPLWNPFEGLGQPLAGEMQSAAFFLPFVLLLALPQGVLLFHVALQLVAGIGTLLFLRSLRLTWLAAAIGGCLFALNGTFSLILNAPFNPIAFLPWALYGIELIAGSAVRKQRPRLGLWVTVFAVAFMVYAGFPETAALEICFVVLWAILRMIQLKDHRRVFALWAVVSGVGGAILAAPALVVFRDFLSYGYTGPHEGIANNLTFNIANAPAFLFPYLHGSLAWGSPTIFGATAGYLTLGAVTLGVVGLLQRKDLLRNVVLAVLLVVLLLNQYGFSPVVHVIDVVPGLNHLWNAKYGIPLIEFVVVLWAAQGIDAIQRRRLSWRAVIVAAMVAAAALCVAAILAWRHDHTTSSLRWMAVTVGLSAVCTVGGLIALAVARSRPARSGPMALIAGAIIVVEAVGIFAAPQLSASTPQPVDTAPAEYLATHLGNSRFFSVGPITANYGSYFGAAQLNVNDIPVPAALAHLSQHVLATPETQGFFGKGYQVASYPTTNIGPLLLQAYFERQKTYRSLSVRYLVTFPGALTAEAAAEHGLKLVFSDPIARIWEDHGAVAFYSTKGGSCVTRSATSTSVNVHCREPATLVRNELAAPGWTVKVNGTERKLTKSNGLLQSVALEPGDSAVEFRYVPQYFVPAAVASLIVVLLMMVELVVFLVRRTHRTRQLEASPHGPAPDELDDALDKSRV
ncbi:MAG: hypothetical protein ACTHON_15645 [Humibacter sp.]